MTASSGFNGTVSLFLEGLPTSTAGGFAAAVILPSTTTQVIVRAAPDAPSQLVTLTVRGSTGTQTVRTSFTVEIQARPLPAFPRFSRVSTDAAVQSVLYDASRRRIYASVTERNRVEVFSAQDERRIGVIPVPRPIGMDLTLDGRFLLVGTAVEVFFVVDADTLEVVRTAPAVVPGLPQARAANTPVVMRSGRIFFRMAEPGTALGYVVQWDQGTGQFTYRADAPRSYRFVRSADRSKMLMASDGLGIYDDDTDTFTVDPRISIGFAPAAAGPDGTQFAVLSSRVVRFFDKDLQEIASVTLPAYGRELVYSTDGRYLYVSPLFSDGMTEVIDTSTFSIVGGLSEVLYGNTSLDPTLVVDETGLLCEAGTSGVAFYDVSQPRSFSWPFPQISDVSPLVGSPTSATPVNVTGMNFRVGTQIFFDSTPGVNSLVEGPDSIQVVAPPRATLGPVDISAVAPDGSVAFMPDYFAYGPSIRQVLITAGSPDGGTEVTMYGNGFVGVGEVRVGGRQATILSVETRPQFSILPGGLHILVFRAPPGTPGRADIEVTTSAGTAVVPGGFEYLQSAQTIPVQGAIGEIVYDMLRQRVYFTNRDANRVEVLSLATRQLLAAIPVGRNPGPLALTVDASRLVVGNVDDGTLTILNPDNPAGAMTVSVVNPSETSVRVYSLATTATNQVFVGLRFTGSGCGGILRELDLASLYLRERTDVSCAWLPKLESSADGTRVVDVDQADRMLWLWDATTDSFLSRRVVGLDAAISGDGNFLADGYETFDASLRMVQNVTPTLDEIVAFSSTRFNGEKLHASGSLLYVPSTRGVQVYDVHRGDRRLYVSPPDASLPGLDSPTIDALELDDTGRLLFLATQNGLSILEMVSAPLSVGSLQPAVGPSAGGTEVIIRGSGFMPGTTVSFGGVQAAVTFVDENTLRVVTPGGAQGPVGVSVTSPGGEGYVLGAAFQYE